MYEYFWFQNDRDFIWHSHYPLIFKREEENGKPNNGNVNSRVNSAKMNVSHLFYPYIKGLHEGYYYQKYSNQNGNGNMGIPIGYNEETHFEMHDTQRLKPHFLKNGPNVYKMYKVGGHVSETNYLFRIIHKDFFQNFLVTLCSL